MIHFVNIGDAAADKEDLLKPFMKELLLPHQYNYHL
jgi:hypothetical protein